MQFHLDAQTEDWVGNGVPPAEATRRARMQFGSIEAVKDDCRRVRGLRTADELLSRIQWKTWYGVARLLRWAGCRDLGAAAQRGHRRVEALSAQSVRPRRTATPGRPAGPNRG